MSVNINKNLNESLTARDFRNHILTKARGVRTLKVVHSESLVIIRSSSTSYHAGIDYTMQINADTKSLSIVAEKKEGLPKFVVNLLADRGYSESDYRCEYRGEVNTPEEFDALLDNFNHIVDLILGRAEVVTIEDDTLVVLDASTFDNCIEEIRKYAVTTGTPVQDIIVSSSIRNELSPTASEIIDQFDAYLGGTLQLDSTAKSGFMVLLDHLDEIRTEEVAEEESTAIDRINKYIEIDNRDLQPAKIKEYSSEVYSEIRDIQRKLASKYGYEMTLQMSTSSIATKYFDNGDEINITHSKHEDMEIKYYTPSEDRESILPDGFIKDDRGLASLSVEVFGPEDVERVFEFALKLEKAILGQPEDTRIDTEEFPFLETQEYLKSLGYDVSKSGSKVYCNYPTDYPSEEEVGITITKTKVESYAGARANSTFSLISGELSELGYKYSGNYMRKTYTISDSDIRSVIEAIVEEQGQVLRYMSDEYISRNNPQEEPEVEEPVVVDDSNKMKSYSFNLYGEVEEILEQGLVDADDLATRLSDACGLPLIREYELRYSISCTEAEAISAGKAMQDVIPGKSGIFVTDRSNYTNVYDSGLMNNPISSDSMDDDELELSAETIIDALGEAVEYDDITTVGDQIIATKHIGELVSQLSVDTDNNSVKMIVKFPDRLSKMDIDDILHPDYSMRSYGGVKLDEFSDLEEIQHMAVEHHSISTIMSKSIDKIETKSAKSTSDIHDEARMAEVEAKVNLVKDPDQKEQLKRLVKYVRQVAPWINENNDYNTFFLEEPKEFKKYKIPTVAIAVTCYLMDKSEWPGGEWDPGQVYKKFIKAKRVVRLRRWFKTTDPDGNKCWMAIFVDAQYAKENGRDLLEESLNKVVRHNGEVFIVENFKNGKAILMNESRSVMVDEFDVLFK